MDSSEKLSQALTSALFRILRPLVRTLLRNGMSFKTFSDIAKRVYVEIGMDEFSIPGKKQTISRVSVLSGLTRKEVQRIVSEGAEAKSVFQDHYNRAARVIAGWVRDREFADTKGNPQPLALEGDKASFSELVRRYSGDVPARAVRDELLRVGAVETIEDGRLNLLSRAYIPRTSDLDKLDILGTDVADIIATIDHNLQHGAGDPRFQRKVMYDNLPEESISKFRTLSAEQSQKLLETLDRWLAEQDRDVNPAVQGSGRKRAGIGIYYFEEDLAKPPEEK
ncbi:MAG: DUF6502 family protein [Gammaproteobacteria bacterium]|nr:DUF6502 family protein [Gammaproteobacteria bacterium]MDH3406525.1 DUF6502 family protein [Gammaproteobacteria bacterium]MDH3563073.1 DUF6502 family protein [Gammaproteobacteria bacterium]MDH5487132.1 DUF6502 family protein [Gammaproteobacteria bacterium]